MVGGEVVGGESYEDEGDDFVRLSNAILEKIDVGDLNDEEFTMAVWFAEDIWSGRWQLSEDEFGKFQNIETVSMGLAHIAGEEREYREHRIPRRTQNVRKVFLAGIFEKARETEDEERMESLHSELFGISPGLTDYAGDLFDYIELYEMVKESGVANGYFGQELQGTIKYDMSFQSGNIMREMFAREPVKVVRWMPSVTKLASGAMMWGFGERFAENTYEALAEVEDESDSAFLRLEAQAMTEELRQYGSFLSGDGWIDIEDLPVDERDDLIARDKERRDREAREWQDFSERLGESGLGYEDRLFLKALHEPGMKSLIEDELGVELNDISIEGQRRLLEFMVRAGDDRYDRLVGALDEVEDKKEFAEAFLAMDFGEDFGGVLLECAEKVDGEVFKRCLGEIGEIRKEAKGFAEIFGDERLREGVVRAVGERMTEILFALSEVTEGPAERMLFGQYKKKVSGYEQIEKALGFVKIGLERINQGGRAGQAVDAYEADGVKMWNIGEKGDVLVKVRERGVNFGVNTNYEFSMPGGKVEATMNFAVNVEGDGVVGAELTDEARGRALSIRIDREVVRREDGSNDAEAIESVAVLDLGSGGDDESNPNVVVGDVVAVGAMVRAERRGEESRGYHTDIEGYGNADKFAEVAGTLRERLEEMERRASDQERGREVIRQAA